jgi:hypothetical protein
MDFTIRAIWKILTSQERSLVLLCVGINSGLLIYPTLMSVILVPSLFVSIWQTVVFAYGRTYTKEWYKSVAGEDVLIREVAVPLSPFVVCKNILGVSLYMRRIKD